MLAILHLQSLQGGQLSHMERCTLPETLKSEGHIPPVPPMPPVPTSMHNSLIASKKKNNSILGLVYTIADSYRCAASFLSDKGYHLQLAKADMRVTPYCYDAVRYSINDRPIR